MVKRSDSPSTEPVTMGDLRERQARFVREYVDSGGGHGAGTKAAIAAGFGNSTPSGRAVARVRASEMLRNPRVLQVLRDELSRRLSAGAALGVQTLVDLAANARSEQVRLAAANSLVDRGFGPIVSRSQTVQANASLEELLDLMDTRASDSSPADDGSSSPQTIEADVVDGERH